MKELGEENQRLRKMYVEEKIKAEIVPEALAKSGLLSAFVSSEPSADADHGLAWQTRSDSL